MSLLCQVSSQVYQDRACVLAELLVVGEAATQMIAIWRSQKKYLQRPMGALG